MSGHADGRASQDLRYWESWTGKPASSAERDEAIARFRRLTAEADPEGQWDHCRLVLGKLLAQRAGFGLIVGWAEPVPTGKGWADGREAHELFVRAQASTTLDPARRRQARIAAGRIAAGMAVLRCANDLAGWRVPDLGAVFKAGRDLLADDPYQAYVPIATDAISDMTTRRDESPEEFNKAARPNRGLVESVLAILTGVIAARDPRAVPADELAGLAGAGRAGDGISAQEAGVYHALSFLAHYSRAAASGEPVGDEQALAHLDKARELLLDDHPFRQMLPAYVFYVLADRYEWAGALVDQDASDLHRHAIGELDQWRELLAGSGPVTAGPLRAFADVTDPSVVRGLAALDEAARALRRNDASTADDAIAQARRQLDDLPAASSWQPVIAAGLGGCQVMRAGLSVSPDDAEAGLRLLQTSPGQSSSVREAAVGLELIIEAAGRASPDKPFHGHHLHERGADASAVLSGLTADLRHIDSAVAWLREETTKPGVPSADRARLLLLLGRILCDRHRMAGNRSDLDDGIGALADASRMLDAQPGPRRTGALRDLARALRLRGDPDRNDQRQAVQTGLAALEELAADVLLQTGAGRSLKAARAGSGDGVNVATWALADGRPDLAVQALEVGRAVVLHAVTASADVPELLRLHGRHELADSWLRELVGASEVFPWNELPGSGSALLPALYEAGLPVPSSLRHQVLAALRETSPDADWMARPDVSVLTSALVEAGYDAYVYLIPPGHDHPGQALLVRAEAIDVLSLPHVGEGPFDTYNAAMLARVAHDTEPMRVRLWDSALENLCAWAWDAVVAPVLRQAAHWQLHRPPRLVLIPVGRLGGIPWHAARTEGPDGRPHYAVEDAVFSYAASARQLAQASRRNPAAAQDQPVIVADPTGDLPMAAKEGREVHRRFYPDADCLGNFGPATTGAGTPDQVLARLPGGTKPTASVLHLACHANVSGSPANSYLTLADRQRLTIAEILAQSAGGEPQAPGFLAILGACMSDLTDADHDEALTLASALLAVGASGVVGARWPVEDLATAQFMIMFQHCLNEDSLGPADALRAAQLWMIDQGHAEELTGELTGLARRRRFANIRSWAAFTYQGVSKQDSEPDQVAGE